jgi:hypothetical protein
MAEIALTQGKVALVDDADFEWLSAFKWCASQERPGAFYAVGSVSGRVQRMHRVILSAPMGMDVDHVNGDGLDNRRSNIRLSTRSQNLANGNMARGKTTSRYRGVSACTDCAGFFRAQIWVNKKRRYLGYFRSEEAAALAYNAAALAHFGEFARLNQVRKS